MTANAICPRAPSTRVLATTLAIFLTLQTKAIYAFYVPTIPTASSINVGSGSALDMARKYVVIGGNIDGINKDEEEEDTFNMSKKERRRREREKGAANFQSGAKKTVKDKLKHINFDKLDEKVSVGGAVTIIHR